MYWAGLAFSFVFSWFSYVGAGFALIAAIATLVCKVFLKIRMTYWRVLLLLLAPVGGLTLSYASLF